jgi:hypothetical protein
MGPPRPDEFFRNSVLAGVFTAPPSPPAPSTLPPFFQSPFTAPTVAPQTLPPSLDSQPPDGLMTPDELALLNKILVTDDMTPEGKICRNYFCTQRTEVKALNSFFYFIYFKEFL